MLVVASANGEVGIDAAWEVLARGGSALDAVEAGTRVVEDNPDDHTVGYGGYPNLAGQVELDASIMDGATRRAGAVGALAGYRHAVTVARAVMERLPHVLVAGAGAARLAAEIGLAAEELLTPEAEATWRDGIEGRVPGTAPAARMLDRVRDLTSDPERAAGTVNFLAMDGASHLASAVSTSGWAWKYPGRLGDSPLIGAGNYCDDRYGAAACTGWGELAVRAGTARSVVAGLAAGLDLETSVGRAMADVASLDTGGPEPLMHLVTVDAEGRHHAASTKAGAEYVYRSDGMPGLARLPRTVAGPA
ncbi:MAG: isoaspartyl peptidase/L-asparaginase [Acidimicrobiales bacterium]